MPIDTFIFDSPDFWKAVAFVLSFAVVVFPLWRFCVNKLQIQNQKVILEFNEAVEKQKKADDELNEARKKLENAEIERKQITKVAQKECQFGYASSNVAQTKRKRRKSLPYS